MFYTDYIHVATTCTSEFYLRRQLQFRIPLLCFYFLIFLDQNCEINQSIECYKLRKHSISTESRSSSHFKRWKSINLSVRKMTCSVTTILICNYKYRHQKPNNKNVFKEKKSPYLQIRLIVCTQAAHDVPRLNNLSHNFLNSYLTAAKLKVLAAKY